LLCYLDDLLDEDEAAAGALLCVGSWPMANEPMKAGDGQEEADREDAIDGT